MKEKLTKHVFLNAREDYIQAIKEELLGPGSEISLPDKEHEIISGRPEFRYFLGVLYPEEENKQEEGGQKEGAEGENTEEADEAEDEENLDDDALEIATDFRDGASEFKDNDEDDAIEAVPEEKVNAGNQHKPSSMGISFLAEGDCKQVKCDVSFATYDKLPPEKCYVYYPVAEPEKLNIPPMLKEFVCYEKEMQSFRAKKDGLRPKVVVQAYKGYVPPEGDLYDLFYPLMDLARNQSKKGCYQRVPHHETVTLDFSDEEYTEDKEHGIDGTPAKLSGLRRCYRDNVWSYTIMLSHDKDNALECKKENNLKGDTCIYQPCIRISTVDNAFTFRETISNANFELLDDEEKSLELLYRKNKSYATGLCVSAGWNIDENGKGEVFTDYYPVSEVPQMDFELPDQEKYLIDKRALSMKFLSDLNKDSRESKIDALATIPAAYEIWIGEQREKINFLDRRYQEPAEKNMAGCEQACRRMREGIRDLRENDTAWAAFQLANRAMYMQRAHSSLQAGPLERAHYPGDTETRDYLDRIEAEGYENVDSFIKDYYSWRLFQIAFLLMSVRSVVKEDSPDRDIVDLIWFPTGGGKTEAYLGLTALTIFFRRLSHKEEGSGTSVIMRYTLRLLASQQFTRASTLICACEYIRKDAISLHSRYGKYPLGKEPITIGLWIGNTQTPGKVRDAKKCYNNLTAKDVNAQNIRYKSDKYNHFQLLKCPWCGTKLIRERQDKKLIGEWGYSVEKHVVIHCTHQSCYFYGELPVQVVDDELYDAPPTLLFSTVDKFAMLPWLPQIGNFFAAGTKNRTPDLIIQDELHLISGSLGTIVGLYESAIDELCTHKGTKPKIIASTATIRRAREQGAGLYSREVIQYPHPAIDSENSFFSREAVIDYSKGIYGRKYIGLLPAGKSKDQTEARVIASLMQRLYSMDLPESIKDSYWTLTAYYNSLRELGKAETLLEDDTNEYIKRIANRMSTNYRRIFGIDKLNSRITSSKLNETLDRLEKVTYSKENREKKLYASDVLLATNMISVGIDISRLNVMLMVNQPKLTSEYIQASSRVGRRDPGVIFVQFEPTRSRDRSHYEQFKQYHEAYYKFVEPTCVTPFSKPARSRALHALVISLLRIEEEKLKGEKDAGRFSKKEFKECIDRISDMLINRYKRISSVLTPDAEDESNEIRSEINEVVHLWDLFANDSSGGSFCYGYSYITSYDPKTEEPVRRLMRTFGDKHHFDGENPFPTMTSMRDVDGNVSGNILILEDE